MVSFFKKILRPLLDNALIRRVVRRELRKPGNRVWLEAVEDDFIYSDAGHLYGVTQLQRAELVRQFHAIHRHLESGTTTAIHITLARTLLSIPPEQQGDVVECGTWKGASAAVLSLVCALTGRTLWVCDSFEGLPDDNLERHVGMHTGVYGHYQPGMFCGRLQEVQENIQRYGRIDRCHFVQGFFSASLKALKMPIAFAFLDVDLVSSTRDCLRYLWPLLTENGWIYCDDAADLEVVKVYFDDTWWRETVGADAPGLVGSGCGLPLSPAFSTLGYTRKIIHFNPADWRRASFLYYPEPY